MTMKGKKMGKTKAQFFKEEYEGLKPRQKGLFDDVVETVITNQKKREEYNPRGVHDL